MLDIGTTLAHGAASADNLYGLAVQPNGGILAAGSTNYLGYNQMAICRFTSTGQVDLSYNGGYGFYSSSVSIAATAAALQADNKLVLACSSTNGDFLVCRMTAAGRPDLTWGGNGAVDTDLGASDAANSVAVQSDGRIVLAGSSGASTAIARYQTSNQLSVTDVQPPNIVSTYPNTTIQPNGTFSYTIIARDPNAPLNPNTGKPDPGYGLVYALTQGANAGVTLTDNGDGTALVQWIPGVPTSSPALAPVTISVTNLAGLQSRQAFTLIALPQAGPVIQPIPNQSLFTGPYGSSSPTTYQVQASGSALSYAVGPAYSSDPGSYNWIAIGSTGLLTLNPLNAPARAQPYRVQVSVTDGTTNATATQTFLVRISTAHQPVVTLTVPNTSVLVGGALTYHVAAYDPGATGGAQVSLLLTVNGVQVGSPPGLTPDANGNVAWDVPWTSPTSPQDVNVVATVTDSISGYQAASSQPAPAIPIGDVVSVQPLIVHVYAAPGPPSAPALHVPDEQTVVIDHIPVYITRAYDTQIASTVGDFGRGGFLDVGTGSPLYAADLYASTPSGNLYQVGQRVEVIAPNGRPEGFTFHPRFITADTTFGGSDDYAPDFVPDPGVTDNLSAVESGNQTLEELQGAKNDYYILGTNSRYHPDYYDLTTSTGITYQYNTGANTNTATLVQATDGSMDKVLFPVFPYAPGNTVVAGYNSSGQNDSNITFVRDGQQRITSVTVSRNNGAPATLFSYAYDPVTGNLNSVTDYNHVATNYTYNPDGSHPYSLTGITRAGRTVLSVTYSGGLPTSAVNGSAAPVPVIYDSAIRGPFVSDEIHSRASTLTDGTLLVNLFLCDGAGRPLREIDGVGAITDRTFDTAKASGATATQTSPYGGSDAIRITRFTYDSDGNLTTLTDPQGNRTWQAWSANDKLELSVDPLGNETANTLMPSPDPSGTLDVFNSIDPAGNATAYVYAVTGFFAQSYALIQTIDPAGTTGLFYGDGTSGTIDAGSQNAFLNPDGTSFTDYYDSATGNLTSMRRSAGGYNYDSAAMLSPTGTLQQIQANGQTITFMSDPLGNVIQSSDGAGNMTVFTYDSFLGLLTRSQVPTASLSTAYDTKDYDLAGRLMDSVDALGNQTTYVLDWTGRVISTVMPGSGVAHADTAYDNAGRAVSETDIHGVKTTHVYDAADRLIQTTYADGSVSQTVYDADGRPIAATNRHLGNSDTGTRMFYDSAGNLLQTQYLNNLLITIVNDGNGIYHSVLSAAGTPTATEETVYDAANRPIFSTDVHAPGAPAWATALVYDSAGHVFETQRVPNVSIAVPTSGMSAASYPVSAGAVQSTQYDRYDPTDGALLVHTGVNGQSTQYQYDPNTGRTTVVIDPLSYGTSFTYDASTGRETSITDALGNLTQFAYTSSQGMKVTTYIHNGTPFTITDLYDGAGHVVSSTDALGRTTAYQYADPSGQLTKVTPPQVPDPSHNNTLTNPTATYGYDSYGALQDQHDALGRDTHFTTAYNADGSRTETRTLPGAQTETTTYDGMGRITTHTDFKGQYAVYTYDPVTGRLTEVDYSPNSMSAATEKLTYQYDPVTGNQTQVADLNNGVTTTTAYTYDPETQNLASETTAQAGASSVINYVYDPVTGNRVETWTGTSHAAPVSDTLYGYDEDGRLRTVTQAWQNGRPLSPAQVTTYVYDADGNLSRVLLPNGVRTVYQYDDLNHLVAVSDIASGVYGDVLLGGYGYAVGLSGRRDAATEQRQETDGTYSTALVGWTYDNLDRLTGESYVLTDPNSSGFRGLNFTITTTYDLVGNRLTSTNVSGRRTESTTYAYDAGGDDRLMTVTDLVNGASNYTIAYQYDANGSMTSQALTQGGTTTTTYGYDLQNRLVSSTVGATTTTYAYDPDGNRIEERVGPGTPTWFLIDSNNPSGYSRTLQESSTLGGTPTVSYTIGGSGVLGQASGSGTSTFLLPDGRGSTRLTTDASGNVTARYDFDAFGNALNFTPASALTKYLYAGQRYDSTLGQYDLRARFYSPALGRFTQRDGYTPGPGDLGNANLYVYAGGNPVNLNDPSGHDSLDAAAIGREVHQEIAKDFAGKLGLFGVSGPSIVKILGKLRSLGPIPASRQFQTLFPDLVDTNPADKEIFEIKPDNTRQIIQGYFQLAGYVTAFNELDPSGGWQFGLASTYTPPPFLVLTNPPAAVVVTPPILGLITYVTLQDYANNEAKVVAGEEQADLGDTEAVGIIDSLAGGI